MSQNKLKYFLVTGEPGVGKTTLIKKLCSSLSSKNVIVEGIYTEERRGAHGREGFDVVALGGAGERACLATESSKLAQPTKFRVGKYGVMVADFEKLAIPALTKTQASGANVLVIDEIGKMEMYSAKFKSRIQDIFNTGSTQLVLATVPLKKCDPLIESIKSNRCSKIFQVTRENRSMIYSDIINHLETALHVT